MFMHGTGPLTSGPASCAVRMRRCTVHKCAGAKHVRAILVCGTHVGGLGSGRRNENTGGGALGEEERARREDGERVGMTKGREEEKTERGDNGVCRGHVGAIKAHETA